MAFCYTDSIDVVIGSSKKLTHPEIEKYLSEKWDKGIYPSKKDFQEFYEEVRKNKYNPNSEYALKFINFVKNYKDGMLSPIKWRWLWNSNKFRPYNENDIPEMLSNIVDYRGDINFKSSKEYNIKSEISNRFLLHITSEDGKIHPYPLWLAMKNKTLDKESNTIIKELHIFKLEYPTLYYFTFDLKKKKVKELPLSFYEEFMLDFIRMVDGDYAFVRDSRINKILYQYQADRYLDIKKRNEEENERWLQEKLAKHNEEAAKEKENLKAEEEEENENSSYIVPSAIDENFVYKIKDCKILGLSYNLMQGIKISHNMQKKMKLIIRKDTKLSQDLSDAIRKRKIVIEYVDDILEE